MRDSRRPELAGKVQITCANTCGDRAAQQRVLGTALAVHDMFRMKDHAQTAAEGELLQTEQSGSRGETSEGGRLIPPGRTDMVQPNLRDVPFWNFEHLCTAGGQTGAEAACLGITRVDEDRVAGAKGSSISRPISRCAAAAIAGNAATAATSRNSRLLITKPRSDSTPRRIARLESFGLLFYLPGGPLGGLPDSMASNSACVWQTLVRWASESPGSLSLWQ